MVWERYQARGSQKWPLFHSDPISSEDLIMRRRNPRNLTLVLPVIVSALVAGLSILPISAPADEPPKPAKKDDPKTFKPTTATFTTAVEPAEAKPGDVVTFKVTVKLEEGYHIYKYSKKQGDGPILTSFDFFDPAGLEIEGDWTASSDPEKHKDPNFPELAAVEYHEDEVTWSIKAKIPAGTAAGKRTLRCQARYMICDAKTCSVPGRWTLPDAELTVATGDAAPPAKKAK